MSSLVQKGPGRFVVRLKRRPEFEHAGRIVEVLAVYIKDEQFALTRGRIKFFVDQVVANAVNQTVNDIANYMISGVNPRELLSEENIIEMYEWRLDTLILQIAFSRRR